MKAVEALIAVARGQTKADLVLKHAQVFNVFTGKFHRSDVAVCGGYIAGVGDYTGYEEINLERKYLTPGFIDGHVHIESSMVSPVEFARVVVPCGTTTAVIDPHEVANVAGAAGIRYMLDASEGLPLTVFMMLPSCVPASTMENSGARLLAEDLTQFIEHPRVLGLGELMDYGGVLKGDSIILDKLKLMPAKRVDGHAPGLAGKELAAYAAAGIKSDHECVTPAEARERLALGMYVMLREGSATRNLLDLLPVVDQYTTRHCLFVTDDRHPADLISLGHINHMVRLAVKAGCDLAHVLQMATINTAEYFQLKELGAIAPGYRADMLVFDDLSTWRPATVFKNGRVVAREGSPLFGGRKTAEQAIRDSLRLNMPSREKLKIPAHSEKALVIGLVPHQIITERLEIQAPIQDGGYIADPAVDLLKLAVFERHHHTGNVGSALVKGLGLRSGAIASTVAHDSHNLIVIGADDDDILLAAREIRRIQGGIAVVNQGRVLHSLPLPLAGLMSEQDVFTVEKELSLLRQLARDLGVKPEYDPFMTLAFLSLPVIPALKLTDLGLVDVAEFSLTPVSRN
ncbi:metal-dependent hydrolase [Lucifera butyrica]|uniref:Adenine deaminase n=1 Tax=Lucifera butyrica TaxID=1351585 RepID=A0A498R7H4_9FIRM|nr:adenine deaminase [Lucifera butyrica]VBB07444.1 metal-dependent hydrolase [Lucifera butyrica]